MTSLPPLHVSLDSRATDAAIDAVTEAFEDTELTASVTCDYPRSGFANLPWEAMIAVPTGAFFAALASEAGKDAWKVLKKLVTTIQRARHSSAAKPGVVILKDLTSNRLIILPEDLPEEAWRLLLELDERTIRATEIRWDSSRGLWT